MNIELSQSFILGSFQMEWEGKYPTLVLGQPEPIRTIDVNFTNVTPRSQIHRFFFFFLPVVYGVKIDICTFQREPA